MGHEMCDRRVRQLVMDDLQAALAQQRSNLGICDNSLAGPSSYAF